MIEMVGHLQLVTDAVPEGVDWRGLWIVNLPSSDTAPGRRKFTQIADGPTEETFESRDAAIQAAREIGRAKAQELYDER